jgi:hypothetical protein
VPEVPNDLAPARSQIISKELNLDARAVSSHFYDRVNITFSSKILPQLLLALAGLFFLFPDCDGNTNLIPSQHRLRLLLPTLARGPWVGVRQISSFLPQRTFVGAVSSILINKQIATTRRYIHRSALVKICGSVVASRITELGGWQSFLLDVYRFALLILFYLFLFTFNSRITTQPSLSAGTYTGTASRSIVLKFR